MQKYFKILSFNIFLTNDNNLITSTAITPIPLTISNCETTEIQQTVIQSIN